MSDKKITTNKLKDGHIYKQLEESGLDVDALWRRLSFRFEKNIKTPGGEEHWGSVDFTKDGVISLDIEGCDHESACITLIHELTHVIFSNCGLSSDYEEDGKLGEVSNEILTELVSTALVSFIKHNKELIKLIIEAL